jgi:hypothetical protein
VNDVRPPKIRLVTKRVTQGRPTIVARVTDTGAGVDPLSLVIAYRGVLVGAALYDPGTGIAVFPIPKAAQKFRAGRTRAVLSASDFQEAKNVNGVGSNILPNTAFRSVSITGVPRPGGQLGLAAGERVRARRRSRSSRRELDETRALGALPRRRQAGRGRPQRRSDVFTGTWNAAFALRGRTR